MKALKSSNKKTLERKEHFKTAKAINKINNKELKKELKEPDNRENDSF